MSIEEQLEKKKNLLGGIIINDFEADNLKNKLPSELLPSWYIQILKKFPLVGVNFSLDEEHDQSGMGVDLKWLSPAETIDEAFEAYPGKSVIDLGYIPIGACLLGSGDPYFLKFKGDNSNDPSLVRIPHDFSSEEEYPENEIEIVCKSLSEFFELSEID